MSGRHQQTTLRQRRFSSLPAWPRAIATACALAVLTAVVGCAGTNGPAPTATAGAATNATPGGVLVSCGPQQQAMVRQAVVNGQTVSQVECLAAAVAGNQANVIAPSAPAAVAPAAPTSWTAPEAAPAGTPQVQPRDVEIVPVSSSGAPARRTVYTEDDDIVSYRPARRVEKPKRSWQKSAVIIGASAGAGAGIGAAIGGKKGALIGAAIGGGGATVWDQVTRRKN